MSTSNLAILTKNYEHLLDDAVKKFENDQVGRVAFRSKILWRGPLKLCESEGPLPIYFGCGPDQDVQYSGTLVKVYDWSSLTPSERQDLEELLVDSEPWEVEPKTVYIVEQCRKVHSKPIVEFTKADGIPIRGAGNFPYTVVHSVPLDFDTVTGDIDYPEEIPQVPSGCEGAVKVIKVNSYERNPKLRSACIAHQGTNCKICEMSFEDLYGEIGHNYIHVHHIKALSETGGPMQVDPIHDLIPVCPNCHAMLHRANCSSDELRAILQNQRASGKSLPQTE